MKKTFFLFFILLISFSLFSSSYAIENHPQGADWIDVTVSPTRYELSGEAGETITKPIKIINNSDFPVEFTSSKENCRPKDTTGTPDCSINRDFNNPNTHLSSWIDLSEDSFSIPANSEKNITFTLHVPPKATPGGHFGAVFFSTGKRQGSIITTERRIGVLILYSVAGDTVTNGAVDNITISVSGDGGGWANTGGRITKGLLAQMKQTIFTTGQEVVSGIQDIVTNLNPKDTTREQEQAKLEEKQKKENVKIDFDIGFVNSGNTHIKPQGKIIIMDDGKPLPKISKETIKNDFDAIIGEKIVDYIPINDEGGNVLPNSKRVFQQEWNGFPYEIINEKGEREVKYRNFSEYFSNKNLSERKILMFWEQVKVKEQTKRLTAQIEIGYKGEDEKQEEFDSAKDFSVIYTEQYIGYNWFVVLLSSIFGVLFIWWIILSLRRRKKEASEIRRLKKKLREQEKEIDKIEDIVEDIPAIAKKRGRKPKEELAPSRRKRK